MNKGILMEIKKDYAIVMNELGLMDSIKLKDGMIIGQKIFYFQEDIVNLNANKSINKLSLFKTFGTFAALFLLIFTFFQPFAYQKAYAVVSLDINPSIQIEVNNKKKIVKVEGINADGKNIDLSSVNGLDINDGIENIKSILVEKNYLNKDGEVLVGFALLDGKEDETYENTIKDVIQTTFKSENVTYVKANKDAVEEAKTKGISLGRYEATRSLNEDVKSDIEDIPVKEITSLIKDKGNYIHWEADDVIEIPKIEENMPKIEDIDKAIDKPIDKLNDDVTSNKDKNNQPIKEIAPPVEKPNSTDESIEIKQEPGIVPETKPEVEIPSIEIPKPEEDNKNSNLNNQDNKDISNEDNSKINDTINKK
ncbi:hypothetical protein UT300005_34620 [Clostridium sp. CTA-5]